MEILGEAAIARAQAGPSSDIYRYGEAFQKTDEPYYDDAFDAYEYDLICGLYTTDNCKCV